jgi:hypothetical protein
LKGLGKTMISQLPGQDLNLEPSKYEASILTECHMIGTSVLMNILLIPHQVLTKVITNGLDGVILLGRNSLYHKMIFSQSEMFILVTVVYKHVSLDNSFFADFL